MRSPRYLVACVIEKTRAHPSLPNVTHPGISRHRYAEGMLDGEFDLGLKDRSKHPRKAKRHSSKGISLGGNIVVRATVVKGLSAGDPASMG